MRPQITWQSADEELEFYPPWGRCDAASTVIGYRAGTSELWGSEPVSLDPYTDNITATEGEDIGTVTDTTNAVVGRRYWLSTAGYGRGYSNTVVDIISATQLRFAVPFKYDMLQSSGDRIEGHRLARTMTATETTAVLRSARAQWILSYPHLGAVPKKPAQRFDVVLWPLRSDDVQITEHDLRTIDTDFSEAIDVDGLWRGMVEMALSEVFSALERSYKPDLLRSRDMLRDPMMYRILMHRFRNVETKRTWYASLYEQALSAVLSSTVAWYDSDDDMLRGEYGMRWEQIGDDWVAVFCDDDAVQAGGEGFTAPNQMMVT
jgi:hypothetical protein